MNKSHWDGVLFSCTANVGIGSVRLNMLLRNQNVNIRTRVGGFGLLLCR